MCKHEIIQNKDLLLKMWLEWKLQNSKISFLDNFCLHYELVPNCIYPLSDSDYYVYTWILFNINAGSSIKEK